MGGTYRPWIVGYFQPSVKTAPSISPSIRSVQEQSEPSQEVKVFAAQFLVDKMLLEQKTPQQIMDEVLEAKEAQITAEVATITSGEMRKQYLAMKVATLEKVQLPARMVEKHKLSLKIQNKIKEMDDNAIKENLIKEKLSLFKAEHEVFNDIQFRTKMSADLMSKTQQIHGFIDSLVEADKTNKESFTQKIKVMLWLKPSYIDSLFGHFQADTGTFEDAKQRVKVTLEDGVKNQASRILDEELKPAEAYRKGLVSVIAALDAASMKRLVAAVAATEDEILTSLNKKYNWSENTFDRMSLLSLVGMGAAAFTGIGCLLYGAGDTKDFTQMKSLEDPAFYLIVGSLFMLSSAVALCVRHADDKGAEVEKNEFAKLGFKRSA
ncbi:MAG: hypothetical protein ACHQAX_03885 [Gammaproteobacteria bacterium]